MINTMIFSVLSYIKTCLGYWIFQRNFPEKRWKSKSTRVIFWGIFIFITVEQAWDAQHAFISYLQVIVYSFLNALILKIFYVCEFKVALLWELCFYTNIAIVQIPLLTVKGVIRNQSLLYVNVRNARSSIENIWLLIIILLILGCYIKWEKEISLFMKRIAEKWRSVYLFFVFVTVELILLNVMMKTNDQVFKAVDMSLNILMILIIILGGSIIIIYFFYKDSKKEQEDLENREKVLLNEQNTIKEYYQQDAKRLHDTKHVLMYIQKCVENNEMERIQICLNQYLTEVEECQNRIWTGVPEVDFIVNYEHQKMEKKGIKFLLDADIYDVPILQSEFMILLGNLMDNAIEASEKCAVGCRSIYLKIQNINNMFVLSIENSSMERPKEIKSRFISMKGDRLKHGWGIESVRRIVNKNEGSYQVKYTDKFFCVDITFFKRRE